MPSLFFLGFHGVEVVPPLLGDRDLLPDLFNIVQVDVCQDDFLLLPGLSHHLAPRVHD